MPASDRSPIVIVTGGLAVRFRWIGDRWEHEVVASAPGRAWRSVEGPGEAGDPRWPASPAWVELSRLGPADDAPLLAVGQAGRTHYSAVVSPDPVQPATLRFDVAARIQGTPGWLGSTYCCGTAEGSSDRVRIAASAPLGPASLPVTVRWCYRLSPGGVEPLAGASVAPAAEA